MADVTAAEEPAPDDADDAPNETPDETPNETPDDSRSPAPADESPESAPQPAESPEPGEPAPAAPGAPESADAQPAVENPSTSPPAEPAPPPGVDLYRNSISCGSANRGSLRDAAELPRHGLGFEIPEPWWSRDRRYGTDELVDIIRRAAARVNELHPGGVLGVADLSSKRGGAISSHRSHQSGRDADLIFYALDAQGQPFRPDNHMAYYSRSGRAHYAKAPKYDRTITERFFDLPRNWALVKQLMTDSKVRVQHMFVSRRIRRWLLRYAEKIGEDPELVKRASRALKRPTRGGHNDHMHIRVSCTSDDIALGRCKNQIARGRRKFYSRIRCPAKPRSVEGQAPSTKSTTSKR